MVSTSAARGESSATGAGRIIILAALPLEVRPFLRRVKARVRGDLGLPAWEWLPGPGLLVLSGMGEAAARRAGETMLRSFRPGVLVSVGFGGALAPGLAPGDLILGETFWRYNPDTGELRAGASPTPPRPLAFWRGALRAAGFAAATGSLVATTRIIHKARHGPPLAELPHPVLDLETGALAELAAAQGLAFLSLRAITDAAGEEIPEFLRKAGNLEGKVGVGAALRWLGADFRRLRDLWALWRRSRGAAARLAGALTVLWPLLLAAGSELEDQPGQEGQVDEDPYPA
jgi:nucleoside phosphorylase